MRFTIFIAACVAVVTEGFVLATSPSSSLATPPLQATKKVVVTGAGGKTGQLLFEKLLSDAAYEPVGVVRSTKKAALLKKKYGASDSQVVIGDISADVSSSEWTAVSESLEGAEILCVVTSAVPVLLKRSLAKMMFRKLTRREVGRPEFKWSTPTGTPENVDYEGQVKQFDAAVAAGVKKIVVCSSMGGTQDDNFLNTIGKQEDGSGGDILKWKRKAEKYLLTLPVSHAIVHPGGLTDKPAASRRLVCDVNDALLDRKKRSIFRGDVAAVMLKAIATEGNQVFDVISEETEGGNEGCDMSPYDSFVEKGEKVYAYEG